MAVFTFIPLHQVDKNALIALMNHPRIGTHLPLLQGEFTETMCEAFLADKKQLWQRHGFGPYGFFVGNALAGWGGLQQEGDEVDAALVLHPHFWGIGTKIFAFIKKQAFEEQGLSSITALLPPGRKNRHAITRFGFVPEGQTSIHNVPFTRFRLKRENRK